MTRFNSNIARVVLAFFCLCLSFSAMAAPNQFAGQDNEMVEYEVTPAANAEVEMADTLRRDGKIYVVVAVFLVIMAGAVFYLVRIDRKVAKLEREIRS